MKWRVTGIVMLCATAWALTYYGALEQSMYYDHFLDLPNRVYDAKSGNCENCAELSGLYREDGVPIVYKTIHSVTEVLMITLPLCWVAYVFIGIVYRYKRRPIATSLYRAGLSVLILGLYICTIYIGLNS